jgi:peptide/nickel transport system permease protein
MKLAAIRPIGTFLARELFLAGLLLLGVSALVFLILYLSPGDPFSMLLEGPAGTGAGSAGVREGAGAGRTWYGQYLAWLARLSRGDFGTSIRTGLPVLSEVLRTGLNTLVLTLGSLLVTLLFAAPVAARSATRGMTKVTWTFTVLSYVVSALPVFWLGYIVIYFFTRTLGIFPLAFGSASGGQQWVYLLLPVLVLGIGNGTISEVIRSLREEMGRVMEEDYIRTARAKGAPVWKHAFKEGFLIPVTEILAAKIPFILGGAVIVEQVFNWPGMGRMAWQAAQDRDYPVIMGIAIVAAVLVRLGSLLQSIVYVTVNPRASKE